MKFTTFTTVLENCTFSLYEWHVFLKKNNDKEISLGEHDSSQIKINLGEKITVT